MENRRRWKYSRAFQTQIRFSLENLVSTVAITSEKDKQAYLLFINLRGNAGTSIAVRAKNSLMLTIE